MAFENPASPFAAAAQGYQFVTGIRDDQIRRQQLAAQQQAALEQQRQLQSDIFAVRQSANPSQGIADLALKYPQLSEQFKRSYDMMSAEQQQNRLSSATQVYAALQNGQQDIALKLMRDKAEAMKTSGAANEAQGATLFADLIEKDPQAAKFMAGLNLATAMGPEKFATTFSTLGQEQRAAEQAPADLARKNAEAGIKGVEAAAAPQKTALELGNAAEDIETKRSQREIARLDTQIKQANSETQRGELILKRDELVQKQAEAAKAKADTAQSKLDKIDLSLNTVNSIFNHPGLKSFAAFGGPGSITGKIAAHIPGSDRKDLQGLVDTLQAQQFLTGVQNLVGMGALSDAEGKKIGSAVASLDLDQSPGAFKNALGVIKTTLEKAQRNTLASGTAPTQGGGFVLRHPKFGSVTEGDINRMMANNPGSTREQVLQYLQSTGGANQIPR